MMSGRCQMVSGRYHMVLGTFEEGVMKMSDCDMKVLSRRFWMVNEGDRWLQLDIRLWQQGSRQVSDGVRKV